MHKGGPHRYGPSPRQFQGKADVKNQASEWPLSEQELAVQRFGRESGHRQTGLLSGRSAAWRMK